MAKLSDQELEKLMKLVNIHLQGDEREQLLDKLDNIIGFLGKLNAIDTTDVEPLTHPITGHTIALQDIVPQECENPEDYLANVKHKLINNAIKIKSMLS